MDNVKSLYDEAVVKTLCTQARAKSAARKAKAGAKRSARKMMDGEQNVATVLLIVITIAVGVALFALAKNNLWPVIQNAGNNLNSYASDGQTWTTTPLNMTNGGGQTPGV